MREDPRIQQHLANAAPTDRVIVCTIVRGEILYGIERLPQGKRRNDLAAKAAQVLASLPCEAIPELAADPYATMKALSQAKGSTLDENDLWIAATAMVLDATLVTRDRDFRAFSGLRVDDWTK